MENLTDEIINQCKKSFTSILSKKLLKDLDNTAMRKRVFSPVNVLNGFIYQSMKAHYSCRDAILHIMNLTGKETSLNSAAYCRARNKLDLDIIKKLAIKSGQKISSKKRKTLWVDGTVLRMWSSNSNKEEYPSTHGQQEHLKIPLVRILGLFCAETGAFLDMELGKYSGKYQGEISLFRKMLPRIERKSTLVMDSLFSGARLLNHIKMRGVNFVVRIKDGKAEKLLKAHKIKNNDGNVVMNGADSIYYDEDKDIARECNGRLIKSTIDRKGYRSKTVYLFTNLTKTKQEIEEMYWSRWGIEIAFRHLKSTMGLDMLKCKSPQMIKKEIYVSFIAYNFIVNTIDLCKWAMNIINKQISFKVAISIILQSKIKKKNINLILNRLSTTAFKSPYRREPKALRYRNNRYPLLTVDRKSAKKELWGYQRRRRGCFLSKIA